MSRKLHIYLSGSIEKKQSDNGGFSWSVSDINSIKEIIAPGEIVFLSPVERSDDLRDPLSTFGRDLFQVYCSDLVLVDARGKRGIGIGAEMMFAKTHSTPVVSVSPPNSNYHRDRLEYMGQTISDWVHPFVYGLSDIVVPDVTEAAIWIRDVLIPQKAQSYGTSRLNEAMIHYIKTQLPNDEPMNEIVHSSESLFLKKEIIMKSEA